MSIYCYGTSCQFANIYRCFCGVTVSRSMSIYCYGTSCQVANIYRCFCGIMRLQNACKYIPFDMALPSQKIGNSMILVVFDYTVNIHNVSFFPSVIYQIISNSNNVGVSSSRNSMLEDAHTVPFLCGSMERSSQLFVIC
jgi:hypothetical protein